MKFIISESQKRQLTALNWMKENYGLDKLEIRKMKKRPNLELYLKDNNIIFEKDSFSEKFTFHYDIIWKFLNKILELSPEQIGEVLKSYVLDTFGISDYYVYEPLV